MYMTEDSYNTIKTDLNLLLECLKFQMKCPDLQKQALLTIHSICEKRDANAELLKEMGGLEFVYNLSKSNIVRSDVKETALFTICTVAEASVYCKNSLCRKETFEDLAGWLMKEDIPLTLRRVSVYLLSVLVANNKSGQTLGQTTGCLDILLDLFRTTSPLSPEATLRAGNATQTYQLWASVSSALCGFVNNPQNEEGQLICVAAFPIIKVWLQQIALPHTEIFQNICSFTAMTVSNNPCVQERFSASGGLDTLTLSLVHLASAADTSLLSCQLSVTLSKTLLACITDNRYLAAGLAQYGLVPHLFSLLASPHMDPEDRLSVLLTLGYCTEASEEHQFQLLQCGGLPLIITLLTEDTSEEVRKAATFILQTCKEATMSLGMPDLIARQGECENVEPDANMESFRRSARELLRRIDLLEKRQAKEAEDEHEDTNTLALTAGPGKPSLPPALHVPLPQKEIIKAIPAAYGQKSTLKHVQAGCDSSTELQTVRNMNKNRNRSELKNMSSNSSMQEEKAGTSGGGAWCSERKGTGALMFSSNMWSLEGGRELPAANQLFKPPASVRQEMKCTQEEELQGCEMSKMEKIQVKEHSLVNNRCAGCVLSFEEVNSRTFTSLQSRCLHSCDMHKVLQEATEQFRTHQCNLLLRREYQDETVQQADPDSERVSDAVPQRSFENWNKVGPIRKGAGKGESCLPEQRWKYNGINLTPLRRGAKKKTLASHNRRGPDLLPLKRSLLPQERRGGNNDSSHTLNDEPRTKIVSTRRTRKDFSQEEVRYLLCGVKTYGFSWNNILWSYPFQPGRTNVDLAKKYRRLMKCQAQDSGCA